MKSMLKVELFRFFHRKELYISLLIGFGLSIWLAIDSIFRLNELAARLATATAEEAAYFYLPSVFNKFIGIDHAALPTTILFALFPLLVVLPYATTYAEDCSSGYIKNIVTRTSKATYYITKFLVTIFSAMFVAGSIFLFSIIVTTMVVPELMPTMATFTFPAASNDAMWSGIYRETPYLYLLMYSLLDMVYYGAFATLALAVSILIRQRFVVLIVPTVLFFLSTQVFAALNAWAWMPEMFLRQYQMVFVKLWIIVVEILVLLAVGFFSFVFVGGKKNVL